MHISRFAIIHSVRLELRKHFCNPLLSVIAFTPVEKIPSSFYRMSSITAFFKPVESTKPSTPVSGTKRPREETPRTAAARLSAAATAEAVVIAAESDRTPGLPTSAEVEVTAKESVDPIEVLKEFDVDVHSSWAPIFAAEAKKAYFKQLHAFVKAARSKAKVFPPPEHVYSAFRLTPFDSVRVVILGQDPYHGPGQAHGLAFSVQKGVAFPPSLRNILQEAESDVKITKPKHGSLEHWAKQGVLLLNAVLTVESAKAFSHAEQGWETFTTQVIKEISAKREGVVFLLWGKPAQVKAACVNRAKHLVLEAPHPSPLSAHRGFMGCKHFSKTNEYLVKRGDKPIDWNLDPSS